MSNYLLSYRSLTYAQRVSHTLDHSGIPATVIKLPKGVSNDGCGYGVRLSERYLGAAKTLLASSDLRPIKMFVLKENGGTEEVSH